MRNFFPKTKLRFVRVWERKERTRTEGDWPKGKEAERLSTKQRGLLKFIHVLFELALSVGGLVFVNDALCSETIQITFHVV